MERSIATVRIRLEEFADPLILSMAQLLAEVEASDPILIPAALADQAVETREAFDAWLNGKGR